jgi:hypothetical protein
MLRDMSKHSLALLALAAAALAGPAAAAELKLVGLKGETRIVDRAALDALPRISLKLEQQDAAPFEGVGLKTLLAEAGLVSFDAAHGPLLAMVMVFRRSDGEVVALPLSDLDPAFHAGRIVVADTWDGRPLSAEEGPFRLIVEGEGRPARSARNLVSIELKRLR